MDEDAEVWRLLFPNEPLPTISAAGDLHPTMPSADDWPTLEEMWPREEMNALVHGLFPRQRDAEIIKFPQKGQGDGDSDGR